MAQEGERALWLAVLEQQIHDATGGGDKWATKAEGKRRKGMKEAARNYLTRDSEGLRIVCCCAGLNYSYFRKNMEQLRKRGWKYGFKENS